MIESVNNEKIKKYAKLHQKKYRDEMDMFIVEGEHLIEEAMKRCEVVEIFSLDGRENTTKVSKEVMSKLSDLKNVPPILAVLKQAHQSFIKGNLLMLDNIQDPGNLGTIIRTALAFGIETIVVSPDTVDEYNSKVLRASEGMIFHVTFIRDALYKVIDNIKDNYSILTTDVNGGEDIKDVSLDKNFALIMGNEGNGVSEEISKLADKKVYIPMNKSCESLNVAIATSIILYEFSKK